MYPPLLSLREKGTDVQELVGARCAVYICSGVTNTDCQHLHQWFIIVLPSSLLKRIVVEESSPPSRSMPHTQCLVRKFGRQFIFAEDKAGKSGIGIFFFFIFPENLVFLFTSGSERCFKPLKTPTELLRNCVLTECLLGLFRNKSYCTELNMWDCYRQKHQVWP